MKKSLLKIAFFSVLCAIFGVIVFLVALLFGTLQWHNLTLFRMERAFASTIFHPHESMRIGRYSYVGTIYESGDSGCHFYVGEIRTTSLSRDTIARIYKPTGISLFGYAQRFPTHVVFMEDFPSLLIDGPVEEWMVEYLKKRSAIAPTAYIVYVEQHMYSSFGDYRCLD